MIVGQALQYCHFPFSALTLLLTRAKQQMLKSLQRLSFLVLAALPGIVILVGLLGTILGEARALADLPRAGQNPHAVLGPHIELALGSTLVAIPVAVGAYVCLILVADRTGRLDRALDDVIHRIVLEIMDIGGHAHGRETDSTFS